MDVESLTPALALERMRRGAVLVDVREPHERALGMAEGAIGVARADLEAAPGAALPDRQADVLLICQGGARSLQAARALR
ncbi:MAG TPA: rhodanese-like domain-containing protein, partial [Xanthomonadaceae bacterium]|nr:rhodanese-like domain-containing protein [Xanthomonadaceae bacterium]